MLPSLSFNISILLETNGCLTPGEVLQLARLSGDIRPDSPLPAPVSPPHIHPCSSPTPHHPSACAHTAPSPPASSPGLVQAATATVSTAGDGVVDWRAVAVERLRLRRNWTRGRFTVRTFEGHAGSTCMEGGLKERGSEGTATP